MTQTQTVLLIDQLKTVGYWLADPVTIDPIDLIDPVGPIIGPLCGPLLTLTVIGIETDGQRTNY